MKCASLFLAFALVGCSAMQSQTAADSEELLAQAGFRRQPLGEPGLPARQLVREGATYKFADPDFCRCLYIGTESDYAELQRLRAERIADHEWYVRRAGAAHSPHPQAWTAWRPEGLEAIDAPVAAGKTADQ
jgi:hypothetical protein